MKTTHWMLAALTLLVFTSLASPVMAQNDARELYLEAKKLLETRDYAAAAEHFIHAYTHAMRHAHERLDIVDAAFVVSTLASGGDYASAAQHSVAREPVLDDSPFSFLHPDVAIWPLADLLHNAKAALELQFDRYPDEAREGDSEELAIRIQARLAEMGDAKAAAESEQGSRERVVRPSSRVGQPPDVGNLHPVPGANLSPVPRKIHAGNMRAGPVMRLRKRSRPVSRFRTGSTTR